jgi:hypothetical protein
MWHLVAVAGIKNRARRCAIKKVDARPALYFRDDIAFCEFHFVALSDTVKKSICGYYTHFGVVHVFALLILSIAKPAPIDKNR